MAWMLTLAVAGWVARTYFAEYLPSGHDVVMAWIVFTLWLILCAIEDNTAAKRAERD